MFYCLSELKLKKIAIHKDVAQRGTIFSSKQICIIDKINKHKFIVFQMKEELCIFNIGEKLTDEEVDQLIQGMEDPQGNINYEGMWLSSKLHLEFFSLIQNYF